MLINRIFLKVKTYLNTEGRGNFKPERFNLILHDAIQSRNDEYFYEYNRMLNRQNRGLMSQFLENLPERILEKIMHYHKTETLPFDTNSTRELPVDLRYIDTIELTDGTYLEQCYNSKEFNILKGAANAGCPIFMKSGNDVRIYPDFTGLMSVSYLRTVDYPKWTYQLLNGNEVFDSSKSDFKDADIHISEEDEIVRRVLLAFGVNLKEQDVQAFAMNEENTDFNKNNQS